MIRKIAILLFIFFSVLGCSKSDGDASTQPTQGTELFGGLVDITVSPDGVLSISQMSGVHRAFETVFDKYTNITAPNGKQIHLVGQNGVSREKLARARRIMEFYLRDADNTQYGSDKADIANSMANNNAILLYFNTYDDMERALNGELGDLEEFNIAIQDLYADESVIEGDYDYLNNSVRDASFEEIFHLVHGSGIDEAIPSYSEMIDTAMEHAYRANIWTPDLDTYREWEAEGSLGKEYIISVIDVYYGLWAHESGPAFYGEYQVNNREALLNEDAMGLNALRSFLAPYCEHNVYLDKSFEGTFSLICDPSKSYTLKSRYLKNITLTGANSSNMIGNELDNVFCGNRGNNKIDGGAGIDTLRLIGNLENYSFTREDDEIIINDSEENRSGTDRISNIEYITVNNLIYPVNEL